ncbi:MAG: hypothetical protein Q9199_004539 [Rusavskia elegans]
MSGAGEERWRTRGHQSNLENQNPNQHRQNNQQRQRPSREGDIGNQHQGTAKSGTQGLATMSGNAWANNDRSNREAPSQGPAQEQHVPVNGFNAQEARDTLRMAFGPASKKEANYRASNQAQGAKSGGPWASKPNTMANGKDFFLELRKQLSSIQQTSPERAGG